MAAVIVFLLMVIVILWSFWQTEKRNAAFWMDRSNYWCNRAMDGYARERELLDRLAEDDGDPADWWKRGEASEEEAT